MDFPPVLNLLTQFGCGFVLLRSLSRFFNILGLFLMLTFWFKVWRFGWNSKSAVRFLCDSGTVPKIRFCLDKVAWGGSKAKTRPFKKVRRPRSSSSIRRRSKSSRQRGNAGSEDGSEGRGENERDIGLEDEVYDVTTLRKMVKIERLKANAACADLETERTAAASSAEEAMAMILRLQNEKSSAEIQATQFRRMTEQKLDYDQEVIESLQWTITQHELQKAELEDQVEICRDDLRQFMRDEDIEQIEVEVSRDYTYNDDDDDDDGGGGDCDGNSVVSSPGTESQILIDAWRMRVMYPICTQLHIMMGNTPNFLVYGCKFVENWIEALSCCSDASSLEIAGFFVVDVFN
ncbi:unnamed protein product [Sphenostylis stenocarpa]|uniref:GTD-binding domain-containing protein n=1 Tax=Sphenostylis stenocarpa TaxID=92480 RepID=A0AA86S7G7_9FABA|nr:unnamed protein product [Sphenostylis stenocarpa]